VCAVNAQNSELWSASVGTSAGLDAVFAACSLSKAPFVLVVAQLALDGRLDLEAPLGSLISQDELHAAVISEHVDMVAACTPIDILSHRTGLPNWRCSSALGEAARCELRGPVGAMFSYSGEAFVLLQLAVQELTGLDLQTLAQQMVFGPLHMSNTSYVWEQRFEPEGANPVLQGHPPPEYARPAGPVQSLQHCTGPRSAVRTCPQTAPGGRGARREPLSGCGRGCAVCAAL
jgi:CubicO group peptidase (beta-lactamase class C family)